MTKFILSAHRVLWELNIQHCDISIGSIMVREGVAGKCGVLNDWDLSIVPDGNGETRNPGVHRERTGTVPFMALDMLTPEFCAGLVKREYRHELESFIWMLPWVFLQYFQQNRSSQSSSILNSWSTAEIVEARGSKVTFLSGLVRDTSGKNLKCAPRYAKEWEFAMVLLEWVYFMHLDDEHRQVSRNKKQRTKGRGKDIEPPSEEDILSGFWDEVRGAMEIDKIYFDFIESLIPPKYHEPRPE